MQNFRHSVLAIAAIAMIGTLTAAQTADLKDAKNNITTQRIIAPAKTQNIVIAETNTEDSVVSDADNTDTNINTGTNEDTIADTAIQGTAAQTAIQEEYIEEVSQEEIDEKSSLRVGYVNLTSGTLSVRQDPSDESEVIDELNACDQVEVLDSSEGWIKVSYGDGQSGYVSSEYLTDNKADAEYAKMHYDNYKKAVTDLYGDSVRVRAGAGTDSNIIEELGDNQDVIVLWSEGDFIRICYGDDYREGYIIDTALSLTGEWVEKDTVSEKQEEVAREKAAAEEAERIARENAARASVSSGNSYNSYSQSESQSSSSSSSGASSYSSTGQAIVDTAMNYLGVPYVWGGSSPSGFDCSGLVQYVCRKNGISVSRVAADQRGDGSYVSRDNLQPGDLVFFANGGYIHHVGIYVGNGNMIHAPQTGDVVKISSINTDYRISQYAGAVRVY